MYRILATCLLSLTGLLQAASPDISNLSKCINEVRKVAVSPPTVPTFDRYAYDYYRLLKDLETTISYLPYVYKEAAAKPLIAFLENLCEARYLEIFNWEATDEYTAALQQIIPDAVLSLLEYDGSVSQGVNAFQEIVSDLYDAFLSNENRVGKQSGIPIEPPTYGSIPPLVKFGAQEVGPYTWPADATSALLGMGCGIVSLPPSQLKGGLLAWSSLGHETGGHDVTHADEGLLEELANHVYAAVLQKFGSKALANYWAICIDEATADVCGYLNLGPSLGIALVGYFRALGDGTLRTIAYIEDPHPIDLLRGYLGAAVVKRLSFKNAAVWSQVIAEETKKDNGTLYFVDEHGDYYHFPVSFHTAVASTDVVAQTIMNTKLACLQGHSLQELEDWTDHDQALVDQLVAPLRNGGNLPASLQGPKFYAAYVVAAATEAGLQKGTNLYLVFKQMKKFLASMHFQNPTWSKEATEQSIALLEHQWKGSKTHEGKHIARHEVPKNQEASVR